MRFRALEARCNFLAQDKIKIALASSHREHGFGLDWMQKKEEVTIWREYTQRSTHAAVLEQDRCGESVELDRSRAGRKSGSKSRSAGHCDVVERRRKSHAGSVMGDVIAATRIIQRMDLCTMKHLNTTGPWVQHKKPTRQLKKHKNKGV